MFIVFRNIVVYCRRPRKLATRVQVHIFVPTAVYPGVIFLLWTSRAVIGPQRRRGGVHQDHLGRHVPAGFGGSWRRNPGGQRLDRELAQV